jgi:hypothetical protein
MKLRRGVQLIAAAALAACICVSAAAQAAPEQCELGASNRAAVEGMLAAWQRASRSALRARTGSLPWIVFFDETCVWHVNPAPGASTAIPQDAETLGTSVTVDRRKVRVVGFRHGGMVRLPSGDQVPPQIMSFASTYGDGRPFFVMAMPSIWRAEPRHAADPNLDALVRCVFVHEMTHTLQTPAIGPRLDAVIARQGIGDEVDDDIVQKRFGDRVGFRVAYERERDLLYRAAATRDVGRRRALAAEALAVMQSRRARFFTGADADYNELEDLFLNMEGVAQWAAYRTAMDQRLAGTDALAFIRRGGRFWSQDEGLAIFLVVDSLVPNWQARVLGPNPPSVVELLGEAARPGRRVR